MSAPSLIRILICCGTLHGTSAFAEAPNVKVFEDQLCQYTLPSPDWEWRDDYPSPHQRYTRLMTAVNKTDGAMLNIVFTQIQQVEFSSNTYESFEYGMLKSSKIMKKVSSRHLEFKGVPSYEIVTSAGPAMSYIRVVYANDRIYLLQLACSQETDSSRADSIFEGFAFTEPPRALLQLHSDENEISRSVESGKRTGKALDGLLLVGLFIFGIVMLVHHNSKKSTNPTWTCRNCDNRNSIDSMSCLRCESTRFDAQAHAAESKRTDRLILYACAATILIGLAIAWLLSVYH